ncbi:proton-conducting transporter transmembrane domain-containing protein [Halarchaeum sp. P4]|uniref:proton-conducting transporter transmembrane domain-containing protein n=1 Tax=Halarchaeum sp. P4 TaxID=3421639 RepID=UPI003EBD8A9D
MSEFQPLVALVVTPVVLAVALPLVERWASRLAGPLATGAYLLQVGLAALVTSRVLSSGPVRYALGGFPPSYGIELVVDGLGAAVVLLVAVVGLGAHTYTRVHGPRDAAARALGLLLVAGLSGIAVTGDLFNLYVFLEIAGIAAYALVARSSGGAAALAAFRYLLVGTVGATLYLLGVAYAYAATGTLNFAALAAYLAKAGYSDPLVVAGFGFALVGLAVKIALVPAHTWLPDAHSKAPASVSVLLSGLVTTAAVYALVRLLASVYTPAFLLANPVFRAALVAAGVLSVLVGGVAAFRQHKLKRLLAYSTVAQLGLVVAGVGLASEIAVRGAVIHLLGHAVMKGGLFLAAGALAERHGATTLEAYDGLGRREPLLGGAVAVLALGMVGFPPTVGFVGKWYVAVGALQQGAWALLAVVLLSTFLSLAYFGPLVRRLFFPASDSAKPGHDDASGHHATDGGTDYGVEKGESAPADPLPVGAWVGPVVAAAATVGLGIGAHYVLRLVGPALEVFP